MLVESGAFPRVRVVALVSAFICSPGMAQQPASPGTVLTSDLQLAIGAAISKASYQKAPIESALKQLQNEVNLLESTVNSGQTIASDSLAASLQASTGALKALKPRLYDPDSAEMVRGITEDVRVKNAATAETLKLFGMARETPEVTVHINAIKGSQPQGGYSAILVPVGYGKEKAWKNGELDALPPGAAMSSQFTPKASAKVLPGLYWVQVYKTKLLVSRLMQVLIDTKEIDVDLP